MMITKTISTQKSLWEQARQKAGLVPISAVIRELLKLWLRDEIKIQPEGKANDKSN